ncbi:MAG TPA: MgtC/SapB family protein [Chloroflexota bacterium]|jgi:putative Mg2+ transporter-C (MgtC) family protein|nr:MgtC/SapB family protein [Chloroflexota bacterium]
MISVQDIALRLLVALVASGLVGLQRSLTGKVAGMRTHILVGVGAAVFTLVSAYAFEQSRATPDRIAAQVVSGLGFIAGGVILKERGSIRGLTTAAGLWAVAALGMAAGAGLFAIAFTGAGFILVTLVGLRFVELWFPRRRLNSWEVCVATTGSASKARIEALLRPHSHRVWLIELSQGEATRLTFGVEAPRHLDLDAVTATLRADGANSVSWTIMGNLEE